MASNICTKCNCECHCDMDLHVPNNELDTGGPCICMKCECNNLEDGIPHVETGD